MGSYGGRVISRGQFSPIPTILWPLLSPFIIPSRYFYSAALCLPPLSFLYFPSFDVCLIRRFLFFIPCPRCGNIVCRNIGSEKCAVYFFREWNPRRIFDSQIIYTWRGDTFFLDKNRTVSRRNKHRSIFVRQKIGRDFVTN